MDAFGMHAPAVIVPHTSNRQYWTKKQSRNSQRDKIVGRQLKQSGWNVIRIWEHELRNSTRVLVRIERARQAK